MKSKFTITSDGRGKIEMQASKALGKILEDIAEDARLVVPKDTMALHDSIEVEHEPGALSGAVTVGTEYWQTVEYGSRPHTITSTGDHSLHNEETGEYFGQTVNHPGTPEQPFMRPALYKQRKLTKGDLD